MMEDLCMPMGVLVLPAQGQMSACMSPSRGVERSPIQLEHVVAAMYSKY